jgi:plastocyanin
MMVVPFILVAVVVALLVGLGSQRAPGQRSVSHAQQILDRRLASGQVSSEEHARRSATLAQTRGGSSHRPTTLLFAVVAVVVMLGALVAWAGTGWDWSGHDSRMAGHMGWTTTDGSADPPVAGAETVAVVATDLRFAPTTVTVTAGIAVNLTLVNDGRVFHDLTVPALGFVLDADPGERASGSLTVDEPGTYTFECSVPGHAEAGMQGTLVVEGDPS